ncbi:MAG: peptidoglycan bridge formation glycyltransferase FemA/FemB family protein [Anaerococcus vaginalis]|nr:peptidoglycan bridge formation glycyltransferase FemA/FemB family protein [Anaerococcus vaginalis]
MEIKEISREEFDDFLKKIRNHSFYSTSKMANVKRIDYADPKLLALVDNGNILAVGMTLIRKLFISKRIDLFVGAYALEEKYEYIFYDKLKDYAKKMGAIKLLVKPDKLYSTMDQEGNIISYGNLDFVDKMKEAGYIENDGSIINNYGISNYQFVKDISEFLPDDEEKLLKSFNNNARRKIKKAKELDIRVRPIKREELEDFKKLTEDTARNQGFSDKSLKYYTKFFDEFKDDVEYLTAEIDLDRSIKKLKDLIGSLDPNSKKNTQRIKSLEKDVKDLEEYKKDSDSNVINLANMILIYQDDEAIYFYGGSIEKYHKLPGAFILQYEAMLRTMKRNLPTYNFFGVFFEGDNHDVNSSKGILRFKQNFNGYIIMKSDAFLYYPNPTKYKLLMKIRSIGHKVLDRFIKK